MNMTKVPELLYRVREACTYTALLFEGKWWATFLLKVGFTKFHGLANEAHNELVKVRNYGIAWDYNAFKSPWEMHRKFQDPLHQCADCRTSIRMIPTLKNRILKRLKVGKYKNANLLAVDY